MKAIKRLLLVAALLCGYQLAVPQTFVMQEMPPALLHGYPPALVVLDDAGKTVASIPVGPNSEDQKFAFSTSSHRLYVLNPPEKSRKESRVLSVVDPLSGHVDRQITVGAGREVTLVVSKDGNRLYCYTYMGPSVSFKRASVPPFDPKITAIDTASNEVIATYELRRAFLATVGKKGAMFKSQFLVTGDSAHLVALCSGFTLHEKLIAEQIEVFSGRSSEPAFVIDPDGRIGRMSATEDGKFLLLTFENPKERTAILKIANLETGAVSTPLSAGNVRMMMLSRDSRSLFVAVDKNNKAPTVLDVVDVGSGGVVEHPLIDRPTRFLRLGSQQAMWVVNSLEMRSLAETGELGDKSILLNKPRHREEQDQDAESVFLNGYPGETISMGEDHAAMLIVSAKGGTSHRVALLDLKQLRVDSIVRTMTAGESGKIRTERYALAFALGMLPGGLGPAGFTGAMLSSGFTNEMLAARPDGKFLYTLDTDSHEVTIVDVQAGTVLSRLPVNHSIERLQVTADGKHLLCLGNQLQRINLDSNTLED